MKLKFNLKSIFLSSMFAIFYLFIAFFIPTNYGVTSPHATRSTNDSVVIENGEFTSNLHTVSVWSIEKITPFGRMIYELDKKSDVYEMSTYLQQLNFVESDLRGQIQKQAAFEQSMISAYTLASKKDSSIFIDYEFTGMIIDYREKVNHQLSIGDIIIDINDQNFNSYLEMGQYFVNHNDLKLDVLRNGKEITVELNKKEEAVFQFYPKYNIKSSNPKFELPGKNSSTGGPSGGMMYTLSIYFNLTGYDKIDEIVAGTGTIRYDDKIGNIGGLVQKLYTVESKNIKHFIVPAAQFSELMGLDYTLNVYPVSTIEEAIEVIQSIFG